MNLSTLEDELHSKISKRIARIAICGLGYVGLPLSKLAIRSGFYVYGLDIDETKTAALRAGRSYIGHIRDIDISAMNATGRFAPTSDFSVVAEADIVVICVPTPLTPHREPDLSYVTRTAATIARHTRKGQLVILESTTYPGTTSQVVWPIFEQRGCVLGEDIFLAFSPEREDPGNLEFSSSVIPKIVGGEEPASLRLAEAFYRTLVEAVVTVSSSSTAEAVKLTENIFRAVNIALVNELKVIFSTMNIDIWEVINAAATKPFGFMPFYPGPGIGGHCIPVDPFYLTWKAREYGIDTKFVELAGQINSQMPRFVLERLRNALDARSGKGFNKASILVIGIAYKRNVDDVRESPALRLIELLEEHGATVAFHDPFVQRIGRTRDHAALEGRESQELTPELVRASDAVLIATDHDRIDYRLIVDNARLVVDTRNILEKSGLRSDIIVKA